MNEIKKIYAAHFFVGLANASSVIYTLYFLSHRITQFQISQLFAVFMITLALFDIPTGSFADIVGYKKAVFIGLLFQSLFGLFFFFYPTYQGFMVGMFFAGLGLALQSGAWSSLIYDILGKLQKPDEFQKIKGKADASFLVASILASPMGSLIYKYYPRVPFMLSFICILFAGLIVAFIKWEFTKKPHTITYFLSNLKKGITLTVKNRKLLAIVIIGIGLTLTRLVVNQNINQPYQVSIGVDVAYIGITAAIVSALQALVSANAYKISKKIGIEFSLLISILIPVISVVLLSFLDTLFALTFIFIYYMGVTFREPLFAYIGQRELHEDYRNTMASTVSFLTSIIVALLLPIWGKGIDIYGIRTILFFLGIFTLSTGFLGIYLYKFKRDN